MKTLLTILALLCAIASVGCVSVKKTYEYDPAPQVWQVNGIAVANLTPQEQETWKGIVR